MTVSLIEGMNHSQEELTRKELNKSIFLLATARGLKEDVTKFLPSLHACDILIELFSQNRFLQKIFYKKIIFHPIHDMHRLNLAAEIMIVRVPQTITKFRQLPLKRIVSNTLKKFLIAGFLSQLHAIQANNGPLGSGVAGLILQYVPVNGLNYQLKNEDLAQKKSKIQSNISNQLIVWRNVY